MAACLNIAYVVPIRRDAQISLGRFANNVAAKIQQLAIDKFGGPVIYQVTGTRPDLVHLSKNYPDIFVTGGISRYTSRGQNQTNGIMLFQTDCLVTIANLAREYHYPLSIGCLITPLEWSAILS